LKKAAKNFRYWASVVKRPQRQINRSFLVLFFKKELLCYALFWFNFIMLCQPLAIHQISSHVSGSRGGGLDGEGKNGE